MEEKVALFFDARIYNEIVQRRGGVLGIAGLIEDIVLDYLDRTEGDIQKPRAGGFNWSSLFLPNGTKLIGRYKGREYIGEIKNGEIIYMENVIESPSRLASKIADGTSVNAWKFLSVLRPKDEKPILADRLRS